MDSALKSNQKFLQGPMILTTQNGSRQTRSRPSTSLKKHYFQYRDVRFHSFGAGKDSAQLEGNWIIGRIFLSNDDSVVKVSEILDGAFPTLIVEDIKGMKYLKIFVNANNCIPLSWV